MRVAVVALVLVGCSASLDPSPSSTRSELVGTPTDVTLPSGTRVHGAYLPVTKVSGASPSWVHVFYKVPYARPPVRALRFMPPAPLGHLSFVDASRPLTNDDRCLGTAPAGFVGSEDCLYVSIATKTTRASASLPVLVYLPGGRVPSGIGDLTRIADQDVVFVVVHHRVGSLGSLSHPRLAAVNLRYRDIIAALEWVQANVAAFGGDPARVTVGGISSGSWAVQGLMASRAARTERLFARVWLGSMGIPPDAPLPSRLEANAAGMKFAQAAGCAPDDATTIPCLQALEPTAILQTDLALGVSGAQLGVIDHDVQIDQPWRVVQWHSPWPMLFGSTSNETQTWFSDSDVPTEQAADALVRNNAEAANAVLPYYPRSLESPPVRVHRILQDLKLDWSMRAFAFAAHQAKLSAPAYWYSFAYPGAGLDFPAGAGAAHGVDEGYLLGDLTGEADAELRFATHYARDLARFVSGRSLSVGTYETGERWVIDASDTVTTNYDEPALSQIFPLEACRTFDCSVPGTTCHSTVRHTCSGGRRCSDDGFCVDCLTSSDCPSGSRCAVEKETHRCSPALDAASACSDASATCGQVYDGAGGLVSCGGCAPLSSACRADINGLAGTCVACPQPITEVCGASCGTVEAICGGQVSCGCPDGTSCYGYPGNQTCKRCQPLSKSSACSAWTCGEADDGCGGTVSCGSCPSGTSCDARHHCACAADASKLPGSP